MKKKSTQNPLKNKKSTKAKKPIKKSKKEKPLSVADIFMARADAFFNSPSTENLK